MRKCDTKDDGLETEGVMQVDCFKHLTLYLDKTKIRCTRNEVKDAFQMVEHLQVSSSFPFSSLTSLHRW